MLLQSEKLSIVGELAAGVAHEIRNPLTTIKGFVQLYKLENYSVKASNSKCVISFRDQGCGIPEEMLPRLGEPFYTLKEKGTGLGLMVCHKIIKQHNGKITYHSKVNEGTLIEITLPIAS